MPRRFLSALELAEQPAPSTPAAGGGALYAKTDGKVYWKDDGGTEYDLTATGGGGGALAVSTKTTNYTATTSDDVLLVDATAGAVTITLPAASGNTGIMLRVKKIDSSTNAAIIDGNASETIDGDTTVSILMQWHSLTLVCDGTGWVIV